MTALINEIQLPSVPNGFNVKAHSNNKRLQVVSLNATVINGFVEAVAQWPVQALEYKPFLRFAIADTLDKLTDYSLGHFLNKILRDRHTGAFLIQYDVEPNVDTGEQRTEFEIKLSTAISHIIGKPNLDAMYGKYYARFTVKNDDNSDSYLRQAHRRMELHNDGTYVDERTDFVLMQKLAEENMIGGDSLMLHVDDWSELNRFYRHPLAKQDIVWGSPKSKNVDTSIKHPVFFEEDAQGKPHMLFIDQFAEPQNMSQGTYLYEMGQSIENDPNYFKVRLPVGSMLVMHNHRWLHGRDKFVAHPQLSRELLRQRGHFTN